MMTPVRISIRVIGIWIYARGVIRIIGRIRIGTIIVPVIPIVVIARISIVIIWIHSVISVLRLRLRWNAERRQTNDAGK